ncbi:4-(cytidine 5'-diphospho)-2-C-methyl-D-erythritol kinase [Eubacteriales bacterium mix99]|jgi:4-diphosphocytidyl-2-C-methyl-D-erythritol kinase|nr:4-(cytidine 5'-diphospho)-2-C-methyl-D-erythritol kinase [Clostridiales bacterium]
MRKIRLRAPGKINWTLDVTGRRPDGYHEVEMLLQSIGLWDEIILTERREGIRIVGDLRGVPRNGDNLAAKAAEQIRESCGLDAGVEIAIHKRIPIAAGLAGGSSDAAAVLVGLNVLWDADLPEERLRQLGSRLGADVPFCISGGTAVARGIGDRLTPLSPLEGIWLVLVKPPFGVSTASVYEALSMESRAGHPDWKKAYDSLQAADFAGFPRGTANVLESVTRAQHPEIREIRQALRKAGAVASSMSGSGPAVFGVFPDYGQARRASEKLREHFAKTSQVYLVETLGEGVEILPSV